MRTDHISLLDWRRCVVVALEPMLQRRYIAGLTTVESTMNRFWDDEECYHFRALLQPIMLFFLPLILTSSSLFSVVFAPL